MFNQTQQYSLGQAIKHQQPSKNNILQAVTIQNQNYTFDGT